MPESTPFLTAEQWVTRLSALAVERWGQPRAEAIRPDIEATAQHLVVVSEFPLAMEQMPGFFMV